MSAASTTASTVKRHVTHPGRSTSRFGASPSQGAVALPPPPRAWTQECRAHRCSVHDANWRAAAAAASSPSRVPSDAAAIHSTKAAPHAGGPATNDRYVARCIVATQRMVRVARRTAVAQRTERVNARRKRQRVEGCAQLGRRSVAGHAQVECTDLITARGGGRLALKLRAAPARPASNRAAARGHACAAAAIAASRSAPERATGPPGGRVDRGGGARASGDDCGAGGHGGAGAAASSRA